MVELNVLTLNLRKETEEDGENNWPVRVSVVIRLIREFLPHLIGTQEGRRPQIYELLNALDEYAIADFHRDWDPERFYPCIFYRRDSVKILESGDRWLSETPEIHASKSWGSAFPRLATWARCRSRVSSTDFLFACTHMDHVSAEARSGQARVLRNLLEEKNRDGLPVILVGDFNDVPGSAPYQTLTSLLKDVWLDTHSWNAGEGTWHGFSGKAQKGRLDWILASPGVQTREVRILRSAYQGRYPSDHFPVYATLQVGGSGPAERDKAS
jgi:endonuclease/exonuclease/phosphatase family metal-dependent hydrolase